MAATALLLCRGGREGGLNAGCCARLGWGAAEEEEAHDDDHGGEGVTMELTAGAQLPGEPPERPLRSPADNACSAPDTAHHGRERGQTPPPPSSPPVPPHCPPQSIVRPALIKKHWPHGQLLF